MRERSQLISRLRTDKRLRASYIKSKLGVLVPSQIRALRLKSHMPRQKDLAKESEMQQSRISMFETPGAANMTIETLSTLAATLRVGLIVKFVPFSEMLRWENSYSQDSFDVVPRLDEDIEFLNPEAARVGQKISTLWRDSLTTRAVSRLSAYFAPGRPIEGSHLPEMTSLPVSGAVIDTPSPKSFGNPAGAHLAATGALTSSPVSGKESHWQPKSA